MSSYTRPGPASNAHTNSRAIAALVCGVIGMAGFFPACFAAVYLGHKALRQIRGTGDDGYGLAKTGLILGYIGVAMIIFGVLLLLVLSTGPVAAPIR